MKETAKQTLRKAREASQQERQKVAEASRQRVKAAQAKLAKTIDALHHKGMSMKDIGDRYGYTRQRVHQIIKQYRQEA